MKKLLLTLFAVLASLSAFAVPETLTISEFGVKGNSYADYTYTSPDTKVTYNAFTMSKGDDFQINNNSRKGSGIFSSGNPGNRVIKSIAIKFDSNESSNASVSLYCSTEPYSKTTTNLPSGDEIEPSITDSNPYILDKPEYKYFYILASNKASYITSVEVEYVDQVDPRTFVTLSFNEPMYTAYKGQNFESPELNCDISEARASVVFASSDETVATVNNKGEVTILEDGTTTISAYIPDENDNYYCDEASYELVVKDPNVQEAVLDIEFFGKNSTGYNAYSVDDTNTAVGYTAVYYLSGTDMQLNQSTKGSGIAVTSISPNYTISKIDIQFSTPGNGVKVYKQNEPFTKQTTGTAIDVKNASQVGDTYLTNASIAIGSSAFAIVPGGSGVIKIKSVTVTYAKNVADDGSVLFPSDAFKTYMINKDDVITLELPEDAPAITYTVAKPEIATVENGIITALKHGNTEITATWDAVPGKWMKGNAKFTVYVKYATLAEVLADAQEITPGFVQEGQTYVGNFPVTVGWSNEKSSYNYVTDGTAWALFYVKHNHGRGAVLEAGWSGVLNEYEGLIEFSNIEHSDITDYTGEVNIKSYDNLKVEDMTVNEVLILNNVTFKKSTPEAGYFTGYYNGQELNFYNMFGTESVAAGTYNVECAVNTNKGTLRLLPLEYTFVKQATYTVEDGASVKVSEHNGEACNALEYLAFVYCEGDDVEDPSEFTLYMNNVALGTLDDVIYNIPYAENAVYTIRKEGIEPIAIENPWKDVLSATAKVVNPVYSVYTDKAEPGMGHVSASFNLDVESNFTEYVADFYFEDAAGKQLYELTLDVENGIDNVNATAHLTWKNDKPVCEIHNLAVVDVNKLDFSAVNFGIKVVPTFPFLMANVEQPAGAAMRAPRAAEPVVSYVSATATPITHEHMTNAKSEVSGVADVVVDGEAVVEFYNLQGVKVEGELAPGLYIRRQGNEATKVVVK